MKLNSREMHRLHSAIKDAIVGCLGYGVAVQPSSERDGWKRASTGAVVTFFLRPSDGADITASRAQRARGDVALVLPLFPDESDEHTVWVGWYEEWKATGIDAFELVGASWTFFWGASYNDDKTQLFRAEWDNPSQRGGNAAQPHWHFDRKLLGTVYRRQVAPESSGPTPGSADAALEELPVPKAITDGLVEIGVDIQEAVPEGLRDLHLSGLHFGMAGWANPGDHPKCWQCTIHDGTQMVRWAKGSLAHAKAEFSNLRKGTLLLV